MNLKEVKNIIFDLGGVIINLNQELTIDAFKKLFKANFEDLYKKLEEVNWLERFEVGEFSSKEFLNCFKQFDNKITDLQLISAWNCMLLNIPKERIELIDKLAKTHNVYLLSNTNQIHYRFIEDYVKRNFEGLDFNSLFKKVYLSHEIKLRKPNKSIFEFVLNDSSFKPEETLFIDDFKEHTATAKSLGIKTHHLNLKENQTLIQLFNEY